MSGDYLWDRTGDDPDVAALEAQLGGFAHRAPLAPLPPRRSRRGRAWLGAGVIAVIAIAAVVLLVLRRPSAARGACGEGATGFGFAVTGAPAQCGGQAVVAGTLPIGAWLETPRGTTAVVQVADIGAVTLRGDSKLRLVATSATQHRLELTQGTLSARVLAPPRLFVVDTPAATAFDLGCAYDLSIEPDGRTRLVVTSGAVSLEGHGRSAYVPMGAEVHTIPGRGPGTPVATGSDPALVAALDRYDHSGPDAASAALTDVLARTGDRDAITVWNLLANAAPAERARLMARLDELAPRPEWCLDADVLAGQPQALEDWRVSLAGGWLDPPEAPFVPDDLFEVPRRDPGPSSSPLPSPDAATPMTWD